MKIIPYRPDLGQEYKNEFKENGVYPFTEITRVLVDKDSGAIIKNLNENNSNLDENGDPSGFDETKHDVMVKFPTFYCKREWEGTELKDSILSIKPDSRYRQDYEVFPCFVRDDGTVRPYVLYPAFKGSVIGGQLRSVPGQKPTASKTISAFRDLARQGRDTKWNIEFAGIVAMVQFLLKVAFQDLNSQNVIGNGWTSKSESATTGATMGLGNRSGFLGENGNQISLFGIEDFYGNVWSFVDGLLVKDGGYYITNSPAKFGDISKHDHVPVVPLMGATDNQHIEGYIKGVKKIEGEHKYCNVPGVIGAGANQNNYYTDYFWSHRKTQTNICLLGANWDDGSRSGAFALHLSNVASDAGSDVGARCCVLP